MTKEEWIAALEQRHGKELQKKFSSSTVAVCGLGGLGSNIAVSLARAGIGRLILIDFDKVDITNLHRQQYKAVQIGKYNTEALSQNLKEAAPYAEIEIHTARISESNAAELLKDADIICEALDSAQNKAMLVNTVLEQLPEKFVVSASGMSGLHTANTIITKRITKNLYICGDGKSDVDADGTLFSSRVMCCAAHQANMILRIAAGIFEP